MGGSKNSVPHRPSWVLLMKENEGPKSCTTVPLTSRGEVEPDRSWDVVKLFSKSSLKKRELELWRSILEAQLHLSGPCFSVK